MAPIEQTYTGAAIQLLITKQIAIRNTDFGYADLNAYRSMIAAITFLEHAIGHLKDSHKREMEQA